LLRSVTIKISSRKPPLLLAASSSWSAIGRRWRLFQLLVY